MDDTQSHRHVLGSAAKPNMSGKQNDIDQIPRCAAAASPPPLPPPPLPPPKDSHDAENYKDDKQKPFNLHFLPPNPPQARQHYSKVTPVQKQNQNQQATNHDDNHHDEKQQPAKLHFLDPHHLPAAARQYPREYRYTSEEEKQEVQPMPPVDDDQNYHGSDGQFCPVQPRRQADILMEEGLHLPGAFAEDGRQDGFLIRNAGLRFSLVGAAPPPDVTVPKPAPEPDPEPLPSTSPSLSPASPSFAAVEQKFQDVIPNVGGELAVAKPVDDDNDNNPNIRFNQLTSTIPSELGLLTNASILYLGDNPLEGSIPTELALLTKMTMLGLFSNQLTSNIPTELGLLTNLVSLNLTNNSLASNIPTELGLLTDLMGLGLSSNRFTSTLPTEIGQLTSLVVFYIHENLLSGTIPTEVGLLSNIHMHAFETPEYGLRMNDNLFQGKIPSKIGQLSGLPLQGNQLTGEIPQEIFALAVNGSLQTLNVTGNQLLLGSIPEDVCLADGLDFALDCTPRLCGCDCACS